MGSNQLKDCPDCGTRNPDTNIFCPQCGYCFLEEPKSVNPKKLRRNIEVESYKRLTTILAISIIVVAIIAGVASYYISREIERSALVTVETGTRWKCRQCAEFFKNRVATIEVGKSDSGKYGVETIEGTCYACLYSEEVGRFADWVELLVLKGLFYDYPVEIDQRSAEFINGNLKLFPADKAEDVANVAIEVDPRLVERDYTGYNDKLIHVKGKVSSSEIIKSESGDKITLIHLQPIMDDQKLDSDFIILYFGVSDILKGDMADCYVIPIDIAKKKDGDKSENVVATIAAFLTSEQ